MSYQQAFAAFMSDCESQIKYATHAEDTGIWDAYCVQLHSDGTYVIGFEQAMKRDGITFVVPSMSHSDLLSAKKSLEKSFANWLQGRQEIDSLLLDAIVD